jgi:hypothetical protein
MRRKHRSDDLLTPGERWCNIFQQMNQRIQSLDIAAVMAAVSPTRRQAILRQMLEFRDFWDNQIAQAQDVR